MNVVVWFKGSSPGIDKGLTVKGPLDVIVDQIGSDEEWITLEFPGGDLIEVRRDEIIGHAEAPKPGRGVW